MGGSNTYQDEKMPLERLIFEFKLSPTCKFSLGEKSSWGAQINMIMCGRMYNAESYPVISPSYIPSIAFLRNWKNDGSFFRITSIKFGHHSNGQNGSYFNERGDVNLSFGNFSTDFFELNHYWATKYRLFANSIWTGDVGFQHHFDGLWRDTDLKDEYYYTRLYTRHAFYFNRKVHFFTRMILGINIGSPNYKTNFDFSPTIGIKPYKNMDMYIAINYYYGNDYYNLRHIYKRSAFMIGIITDPTDIKLFGSN